VNYPQKEYVVIKFALIILFRLCLYSNIKLDHFTLSPTSSSISLALLLGRQRPPEHQDVGLRLVQHVVDPAQALLHPEVPPLGLGHEVSLGDQLGQVLWQLNVAVLVHIIRILVTVVDVLVRHGGKTT